MDSSGNSGAIRGNQSGKHLRFILPPSMGTDPLSMLKIFYENKEQNRIIIDKSGNVKIASTSVIKTDKATAERFTEWSQVRFTYEVLKTLRNRLTNVADWKSPFLQVNKTVNTILKKSGKNNLMDDVQFCTHIVKKLPKDFANSVNLNKESYVQEYEIINFINREIPTTREVDFRRYVWDSMAINIYSNGKILNRPEHTISKHLYMKSIVKGICECMHISRENTLLLTSLIDKNEQFDETDLRSLLATHPQLDSSFGRLLVGTSQMGLITLSEALTKVLGLENANATVVKTFP